MALDADSITHSVRYRTQKYWEFDVNRPNESLRVVDMGGYLKQKNYQELDFVSNSLPFDDEYIYYVTLIAQIHLQSCNPRL